MTTPLQPYYTPVLSVCATRKASRDVEEPVSGNRTPLQQQLYFSRIATRWPKGLVGQAGFNFYASSCFGDERSGPVFPFPRLADGRRQPSPRNPTLRLYVLPDGKINEFWAPTIISACFGRAPPIVALFTPELGFPQSIMHKLGAQSGTKGVRAGVGKNHVDFFCRN